jgi:hypothetical protein
MQNIQITIKNCTLFNVSIIIFTNILGTITPNAYRYMTVGAGYRALRSNDPCPNCAGAEPHKGRKPDCGSAEAEPPKGRRCSYSPVMRWAGVHILFFQIYHFHIFRNIFSFIFLVT